jgi:branched-chain amino acid transport system permease protein
MGQFERGFREDTTYLLVVGVTILSVVAMVWLLRSRVGLGLMAMRDNTVGAGGVGVAVNRTRRIVYLAASALAGIVGALIFMSALNVRPDAAFSINWVAYPIFIVIIGGIGTIEGPILGAIVFYMLREYLDDYEAWSLLAFGLIAIAMMLFAPKGIWGTIQSRWDIELFPVRRRLPSRLSTKTIKEI